MKQELQDVLAVSFTCSSTIKPKDVVKISANNTVAVLAGTGTEPVVGTVVAHTEGATSCVVATKFRERRDDRVAGEDVTVGHFVFGADNKVYQYNPATMDASNVAGLVIKGGNTGAAVETLEY